MAAWASVNRVPALERSVPLERDREIAVSKVEPDVGAKRPETLHHVERVARQPQPRSSIRSVSQNVSRSGSGETYPP